MEPLINPLAGIRDEDGQSDTSSSSSSSSESVSFSFSKITRQQKGLLISICFTEFLIMCCNSLISPLLPPEANRRGISGQMQGWIMASFAGGQFLIFPVFGKYVSRIGSKFMFLSGIFIAGGCTILIGCLEFVPDQNGSMVFESLCFVLQVAVSIGVTAEQTAAFAVASKEFSGYFTTVFGITEVFVGLGLTIGPLVGGVLSDVGGFYLPYTVLGVLVLSSLPFNSCLTPSVSDEPSSAKLRRKSGLSLLRHPSIIITCLAVVVGSGVWSVLDPCLEPHLEMFNLSPSTVGAVFLLLSASYALSCALCGWIAEKLPDNRLLMIPGFLLCGIAHCLLGPSPLFGFDDSNNQLWMMIVALIILGVAMSMAIIPSYDIIMEIATETGYPDSLSTHGLVAGLWSSMYALGEFIGPIWGGYIQDIIGLPWGLTYTAGACIVVVVLLTIMAVYDCYCCEPEDDDDEISEKKPLLSTETGSRRIRSMSEPMRRRRHLSSVLEISSQSSFTSSSNSALASSLDAAHNVGYGSIESSLRLHANGSGNLGYKSSDANYNAGHGSIESSLGCHANGSGNLAYKSTNASDFENFQYNLMGSLSGLQANGSDLENIKYQMDSLSRLQANGSGFKNLQYNPIGSLSKVQTNGSEFKNFDYDPKDPLSGLQANRSEFKNLDSYSKDSLCRLPTNGSDNKNLNYKPKDSFSGLPTYKSDSKNLKDKPDVKHSKRIKNGNQRSAKKRPAIRSKSLGFIYPPLTENIQEKDPVIGKIQGFKQRLDPSKTSRRVDPFVGSENIQVFNASGDIQGFDTSINDQIFNQSQYNQGINAIENINKVDPSQNIEGFDALGNIRRFCATENIQGINPSRFDPSQNIQGYNPSVNSQGLKTFQRFDPSQNIQGFDPSKNIHPSVNSQGLKTFQRFGATVNNQRFDPSFDNQRFNALQNNPACNPREDEDDLMLYSSLSRSLPTDSVSVDITKSLSYENSVFVQDSSPRSAEISPRLKYKEKVDYLGSSLPDNLLTSSSLPHTVNKFINLGDRSQSHLFPKSSTSNMADCSLVQVQPNTLTSNMSAHSISNTSEPRGNNCDLRPTNHGVSSGLVMSSKERTSIRNSNHPSTSTNIEINASSHTDHIYPDVIIKHPKDRVRKRSVLTGTDNSDKHGASTREGNSRSPTSLKGADKFCGSMASVDHFNRYGSAIGADNSKYGSVAGEDNSRYGSTDGEDNSVPYGSTSGTDNSKYGSASGADNSKYGSTSGTDNSNKHGSKEEKTTYRSAKVKVRSHSAKTSGQSPTSAGSSKRPLSPATPVGSSKRPLTPVTFSPRDIIRSPMIKTLINAPTNQRSSGSRTAGISGRVLSRTVSNPGASNVGRRGKRRQLASTSINSDDVPYPDTSTDFSHIYQNNMLP